MHEGEGEAVRGQLCMCVLVLVISGESQLREIFIKTDNDIQGRYFAELIKVGPPLTAAIPVHHASCDIM